MNIRKIRKFITIKLCTQLINSLSFSQIDYCSPLLFSLPSSHIKPLNRIIKSGIRTILCQPLIDHSYISMSAIKLKILTLVQAHLSHSCHQSRSFTCSAPIIWNTLSLHIRSTSNHN